MIKRALAIAIMTTLLCQPSQANEEYKKAAAERARICEFQKAVRSLGAEVSNDDPSQVIISWQRMTVPEAVQYKIPPSKRYPHETWIALDGNAITSGKKLNEEWFKNLKRGDSPEWSFRGLTSGNHSVTVAHKSECGTWDMKGVSFTIGEPEPIEIEVEVTDEEVENYLSASENLGRYADCMFGVEALLGIRGGWKVIRRNGQAFIRGWATSPLRMINHPRCLIQSTGGLYTPPDPDRGIMNCYPQTGNVTGCPSDWLAFYRTDDGTEALERMGPGPAPTAEGRDDQARLSCMAVILQKYNEYGRNLDLAFEDPWLISQGCNKARPQNN